MTEMDVGGLSLDDLIKKKGIKGSKFGNRQRRDGGIQKPKGKLRAWDSDKVSQNRGDGRRRNTGGARGSGSRSLSGGGKAIARLANVPYNITQEDLNDLFGEFRLSRIALHYDFRGKSMGTAELHGSSDVISRLARDFKNVEIDGRPLEIQVVGASSGRGGGIQSRIRRTGSGRPGNRRSGGASGGARTKGKEARKPKLTAEQLDAELDAYMKGSGET